MSGFAKRSTCTGTGRQASSLWSLVSMISSLVHYDCLCCQYFCYIVSPVVIVIMIIIAIIPDHDSWLLLYFSHCNYQYQEKRKTILSTKKSLQRYGPCLGLLECRVQRFCARVYKAGASNLPSASPMVHTQNPQPNIRPSALSPISYPNALNPIS